MKRNLFRLLVLVVGFLIGAVLAMGRLNGLGKSQGWGHTNGQWRYNPDMDLEADAMQRAYIARVGLFAVRGSEVLYFSTSVDSEGNALDADFDYELIGQNLDSRYWSVTLYDGDHFLIPNAADRYSYNLDNVIYEDSTRQAFRITISKNAREINWLPSGNGKNMTLILRLYNPARGIYENTADVPLPVIRKIGKAVR